MFYELSKLVNNELTVSPQEIETVYALDWIISEKESTLITCILVGEDTFSSNLDITTPITDLFLGGANTRYCLQLH